MLSQRFAVEGMSCGHCVATIQKALGSLTGILKVTVDLEKKEVYVEFDQNSVGAREISAKIRESGFDVFDR